MALQSNYGYKENAVGGPKGPQKNPQGAVGMPNGPRATPKNREGAVGMPNGPRATPTDRYREGAVGMIDGPQATPRREGAVGSSNGPRATPPTGYREGAVGMPSGPRATPRVEGAVGMPNGPRATPPTGYREGAVGMPSGPEATPPMYGPPAPAFPEYGNRGGAYTSDGTEGSMRKNFAIQNSTLDDSTDYEKEAQTYNQYVADEKMKEFSRQNRDGSEGAGRTQGIGNNKNNDPSEITTNNERRASAAANGGNSNASRPTPQGNGIAGQDFTGAFRNSDTQGKVNQAMAPQAPAQAAQAQADQFRRYHGTAYDPNSKLDRAKMKALQGAGVQMDKSGMGPQAKVTKQTLNAANNPSMYGKVSPNRKYSGGR